MLELAPRGQDLAWLLTDLAKRVPHTRSVLLLSSDGLVKAAHNLDTDAADHMAALASGLNSLARTAGHHLAHGSAPHHIAIQYDTALLFITPAGNGTCLAVLATHHVNASTLGHEMSQFTTRLHPHLTTPHRTEPPDPTP